MTTIDAAEVMSGLKSFQQDTVNHVFDRFYGPASTTASGRFLVADETGLGKSIVARGVIARAIEHLESVDHVERIDIVYICSNIDLASQNLRRLNVTNEDHIAMTTRLSMLSKESRRLNATTSGDAKKVNLVSFTPGTSFSDTGTRQGAASERALLTVILDQLVNETGADRRITRLIMQGSVRTRESFEYRVKRLQAELNGEPDPVITTAFQRLIRENGALAEFLDLRETLRGKHRVPSELRQRTASLIGALRHSLAKAGVDTLEPDLIILDEFQRFRQLLDPTTGDAAELAHTLFDHSDARVLLLSATPYKPFTNSSDTEDDHYTDFLATVKFLAGGAEHAERGVAEALADYRQTLVLGQDAAPAARRVREELLPLMSRSERPPIGEQEDLVRVRALSTEHPTADDLKGWAALRELGEAVDAPIDLEYWKSVPYFAGFMAGYKPAERLRHRLSEDDPLAATALRAARTLPAATLEAFEPVDFGNGHLRALADETVSAGWWKLLWVPPTMPYLKPGPVFAPLSDGSVTKQVLFSAWTATPTAIAALLSYEADRLAAGDRDLLKRNTPDARKALSARLQYRLQDGRPAGMSTLALFWPHPGLATRGDELTSARGVQGQVGADDFAALFEASASGPIAEQAWEAYFSTSGLLAEGVDDAGLAGLTLRGEVEASAGFREHVSHALGVESSARHPDVATLAAFAPGNIAFRALGSIADGEVTEQGVWRAAFVLAEGLRTLFNRTESMALLGTLYPDRRPYWQHVLAYCADGNLRAVLDEYLFQLLSELGTAEVDDAGLLKLANRAADAMSLRPARYVARDNSPERREIPLSARFAVRYGGRQESDAGEKAGIRQGEIRAAFNSPFAPFVLASTSVGQEGIDFHWWSHSVIHWNLPSNPVDFEQREGRVNRFAGHAVRKNVAAEHWRDVLASDDPRAWRAAFSAAATTETELGEFSPWWMYPGPARIDRVLAHYPLSRDIGRYERLRSALTLYRLTLGQPRQEDMVEMLARRGVEATELPTIDLRAPRRP